MTCGAAARTAMVAMIVKAVKVMRQSLLSNRVKVRMATMLRVNMATMLRVRMVSIYTNLSSTMAANFQSFSIAAASSSSLSLSVIT